MPYLSKIAREMLPAQLQDAPHWFDNLYAWNYEQYRPQWIEVTLWFPIDEMLYPVESGSAQEFFKRGYAEFLECWAWLEERFQLPSLPEFDMRGESYFFLGSDNQKYRFLMALGKFVIGSRKTSTASSSHSSGA